MRVFSVHPEMNLKTKISLPSIFFSAVHNDCTRRFNYFKGNERVYLARVYAIGKTHAHDRRSGISHRWYADKKKLCESFPPVFKSSCTRRGSRKAERTGRALQFHLVKLWIRGGNDFPFSALTPARMPRVNLL